MYAISATVSTFRGGWHSTRQIPTFYLSEGVQGIVSEDHACRIAREILNPLGSIPAECLSVCAVYLGSTVPDPSASDLGANQGTLEGTQ